jgi:large subunit ribosomal protein L25
MEMALTIKAEKREGTGKNFARRLRREGKLPAILYGEGTVSVPLILNKKDIFAIMKSEARENTIFKLSFDSELRDAMIKALQIGPVSDEILHADLIQIAMDKLIRVSVPIIHKGEPVGVKAEGGFVDFITREVEIECFPKDIPEHMEIDISALHLHQSFKVENLAPGTGIRLLTDPATVLVLIEVPHKEEEVVAAAAAEEEVVAEEKEPEVIKKERAEDKEEKE